EHFTGLFGLKVHHRAESKEFGFKNAILPTGIGHIELLQPTDPDKAVGRFLAKHGEGVYLVGFECQDIPGSVERLKKAGVGVDREFSKKMGARGWIAMTWPKRYGGHEKSALERYVVLEEMLAAGAPVSAHWIADRQSGPLLLRFGTEAQRQKFLPAIARGELSFAIGMSEPDSGSDLGSLRTRAERIAGGYKVNGTKIWTSNAHLADYMIATFRTHHDPAKKHEGLTQFLVDTKLSGITMSPIIDLAGAHHFNMVVFEDVFVPEDMRVGEEGAGWKQVTTELAFERSGPERYLSSFALLLE